MVKRLFNHQRKGTAFLQEVVGRVKGLRFLKNHSSQKESSAHMPESTRHRVEAQKESHERLQGVIATFEERSACMEPDFVELGQSLRSLYEAATGLAKKVNDRLATFHRTLTENQIGGEQGIAKAAIKDLHDRLMDISHLLGSLDSIAGESEKLSRGVAAIDRVGFTLKTTVFGFAMESVRSADCQAMFNAFNLELRSLSERIATLSESVGAHVSTARSVQDQQINHVSTGLTDLKKLAGQLGSTAERTAMEIQTLLNESFAALQQTEEITRLISSRANDAVYHMQFGDIIRQKSEHVGAALKEASQLLIEAKTDEEFRARATEADRILAIQISQLELIHVETTSTQAKLSTSFAAISAESDHLLASLQNGSFDRKNGPRSREVLMNDLLRLESLQDEGRKLSRHANETAEAAVATSTQLSERLQEITTVNNELHFLALNAIIKTAALGAEGATLEVLSMEVHRLYRESSEGVALIADSAASIRNCTNLSSRAIGSTTQEVVQEKALQAGLSKIKSAYHELEAASQVLAETVDGQKCALEEHTARLEFLTSLAEDFQEQRDELISMREILAAWKRDDLVVPANAMKALDQRYTMQSEREIHLRLSQASESNQALSPTPGPGELSPAEATPVPALLRDPSVENDGVVFFDLAAPAPERSTSATQDSSAKDDKEKDAAGNVSKPVDPSLGDNVELF